MGSVGPMAGGQQEKEGFSSAKTTTRSFFYELLYNTNELLLFTILSSDKLLTVLHAKARAQAEQFETRVRYHDGFLVPAACTARFE